MVTALWFVLHSPTVCCLLLLSSLSSSSPPSQNLQMCKTTASVNWDGRLYDCDFNQQLDLGIATGPGAVVDDEGVEDTMTVFDLASLTELEQSPILYDAVRDWDSWLSSPFN